MDLSVFISLAQLNKSQANKYGQKAALLNKFFNKQIPLPKTFIIPQLVLQSIWEYNQLSENIKKILQETDFNNPYTINAASQLIGQKIIQAKFPDSLARELLQGYHNNFSHNFLSLRLSEEEQLHNKGAILYVKGDSNFLESMLQCFSHYFAPQLLENHYKNLNKDKLTLPSIIVQEMIKADKSGLGQTGRVGDFDKQVITIESVFGTLSQHNNLSGKDIYLFDTRTDNVVMRDIAIKTYRYEKVLDGLKKYKLSEKLANSPSLTDDEVKLIGQLTKRLKQQFLFDIKVEWVIKDKEIFILDLFKKQELIQATDYRYQNLKTKLKKNKNNLELIGQLNLPISKTSLPNKILLSLNNKRQLKKILELIIYPKNHFQTIFYKLNSGQKISQAIDFVSNPQLIKEQLEIITELTTKLNCEVKIIIPLVRSAAEVEMIKYELKRRGNHTKTLLELATPASFIKSEEFLNYEYYSFWLNLEILEALSRGLNLLNHAETELYNFDTNLIQSLLDPLLDKRKNLNIYVQLDSVKLDLLSYLKPKKITGLSFPNHQLNLAQEKLNTIK